MEDEIELNPFEDLLAQTLATPASSESSGSQRVTGSLNRDHKYAMLGTVGQGAMGEILLALDQALQRKVAYKKVHAAMASNQKVMGRFYTEAQITAQLDHPNIVPIYNLEVHSSGEIAYAMKLIKGQTFKDLIATARQQIREQGSADADHNQEAFLEHFLKICDAMHYAHMKGVIHRDLKPANIMIGPYNEVYVMDWGIAKVMSRPEGAVDEELVKLIQADLDEPEMERTQLGQIMGTPRYMSPQQAAGKNDQLDGRSDLFALGLILFELVTLKPALTAKTQIELIKRVLKADLEPFQHLFGKKLAPELEAIIRRATAKKVEQRYANVEDFANDIRRFRRGEAVLARPDNPLQKLTRWLGQHREVTLGLILALGLLSAGVTIWSQYQQQQTLLSAQAREKRLSLFFLSVGQQAQRINSEFMHFERLLEYLSGSAQTLLEFGKPVPGAVYTADQFRLNSPLAPPDLELAPAYQIPISLDWNTFKLAPSLDKREQLPLMQQLSPLRFVFRDLFSKSLANTASASSQRKLILEQGTPLIWAYVGLKQGVHASYPGKGGYSPAYDPRQRPWYTAAVANKKLAWSAPYIDTGGKGWVLPCTQPLYDSKHQFLGVAGVEMTLDDIKTHFLPLKQTSGFLRAFLLNAEGQIIASTEDQSASFEPGTLINKARELKSYAHPEIVQRMLREQSGYAELGTQAEKVVAFAPIRSLGWYYLVEAASAALPQSSPNSEPEPTAVPLD